MVRTVRDQIDVSLGRMEEGTLLRALVGSSNAILTGDSFIHALEGETDPFEHARKLPLTTDLPVTTIALQGPTTFRPVPSAPGSILSGSALRVPGLVVAYQRVSASNGK